MKVKLFYFMLPVVMAIIVPSSKAEWYYAAPVTGTATTVTFGAYQLASLTVDSHSGDTSITDAGLNGGPTNITDSWKGFYVTITSGTGTGSALITAWDDGTDTITVGTGLSNVTDGDVYTITCRYTTVDDFHARSLISNAHGQKAYMDIENDAGTPSYQVGGLYVDFVTAIGAGETINNADIFFYVEAEYMATTPTNAYIGKMVDGSASPNNTRWTEAADGTTAGATWDYKEDGATNREWEADSSNNITDIFSAVESAAINVNSGSSTWITGDLTDVVADYVTSGGTNIGMYFRVDTAEANYVRVSSEEDTDTNQRWFIVVEWQ